jgi:rSAM/selenodomain-associated transferase 1
MNTIAIAIVCKTPAPGKSKTRLSPPLRAEECAAISACFIRDLAVTIDQVAEQGDVTGYALYTPIGSEAALQSLLPAGFGITPQVEGDFGERLLHGAIDLLMTHAGAILVNSDSPTLPASILRAAVDAVKRGDNVVLSPAADGGYTLIGLSRVHKHLFEDIPWSTSAVHRLTVTRAAEIDLPVVNVAGWYDVDDAESLGILENEFAGLRPQFAELDGAAAPSTREFLSHRARTRAAA